MKKYSVFLVCLLMVISLFACSETSTEATTTAIPTTTQPTVLTTTETLPTTTAAPTTLIALSTPASFAVASNEVSFASVANANKYQLRVRNVATDEISFFYVTDGFNLRLIIPDGAYGFQIRAVGNAPYGNSEFSEEILAELRDPNQTATLEENQLENYNYIRWSGRTYFDEVTDSVKFYFTASGFEVGFYGTELSARFLASNTSIEGKRPHLVVFIDGEENPLLGDLVVLDEADKTYVLATGLEPGYHQVKIMKRSEAIDSNTALAGLSTDGYFASPASGKQIKLQFIAASSSTGFGNLAASSAEPKTTANSDGLLGFPYLLSYMMDAECSIFAASGWGVSRGWNTPGGSIDEVENIPNAFDYYGIDASNKVLTATGKWNHTNYIPDIIVVNLGTNDFNASGYSSMTPEEQTALKERFVTDYTAFIIRLNNYYPNAEIIIAYGLMGDALKLGGSTTEVYNNARAVTDKVHIFLMPSASEPYGSSYHPNVYTHISVANQMMNYIETITDFSKVRDNINYPGE